MTSSPQCPLWLAGMPEYRLVYADRSVPGVLLGALDTAQTALHRCDDPTAFAQRFETEYLAVLAALRSAGMPFRILNLNLADSPLASRLRAEGYPEFRIEAKPQGSTFTYPRDLMVYLPNDNIALISEDWLRVGAGNWAGVGCWPSSWSEGGRVLVSGSTLVVFRHPEKSWAPEQETLNRLRDLDKSVVELPAGVFCSLDREGHVTGLFHDHHIDRAAGLVHDADGALHLLLGPGYRSGPLHAPWDETTSLEVIRRRCDAAAITVHSVPDSSFPYATSLVQALDGTVVAGGGDAAVAEILHGIVGPENVVLTESRLTHFPLFASAGLHCLVTESPEFLSAPQNP